MQFRIAVGASPSTLAGTEAERTRNPWLAIDATTAPNALARAVRRDWERYLHRGDAPSVRRPIAESWRRSHAAGIDPTSPRADASDQAADEAAALWAEHPLAALVPLIRECLEGLGDTHLLVVSDGDGRLLWIDGDPQLRLNAAETINFAVGALWSEAGAGTNAIGTALAADHAVQVFAAEHYAEVVQPWTCSAAPVHDPATGRLLAVIDLTSHLGAAHPHSLTVAKVTAKAVEVELRCRLHERDARLRARHLDRLTRLPGPGVLVDRQGRVLAEHRGGTRGLVEVPTPLAAGETTLASGERVAAEAVGPDAYVVRLLPRLRPAAARDDTLRMTLLGRDRAEALTGGRRRELSPRHSDIVALLCTHPDGLTSGELGAALYGDVVVPSSVRGEVSRLRRLLPGWIETDPYRLAPGVVSDLADVRRHLREGAIGSAAAAYADVLLPHSEAPGVVQERTTLDRWLRHAVLSSGDLECRWTFVQSAAGRDDLAAWKSVLLALPFHDPRRSQAAAELGRLRERRAARLA